MALTVQQLQAFDKVWAEPEVAKLGLDEPMKAEFAQKMLNDDAFRQELRAKLQEIFASSAKNEQTQAIEDQQ